MSLIRPACVRCHVMYCSLKSGRFSYTFSPVFQPSKAPRRRKSLGLSEPTASSQFGLSPLSSCIHAAALPAGHAKQLLHYCLPSFVRSAHAGSIACEPLLFWHCCRVLCRYSPGCHDFPHAAASSGKSFPILSWHGCCGIADRFPQIVPIANKGDYLLLDGVTLQAHY